MNARPPGRVTILWCPVCGRDDRYRDLKQGAGRHFTAEGKCSGTPQELEYRIPAAPEPLPPYGDGVFRAAVAVEVAIRPGLPHLDDGRITFVGRTVTYSADSVEHVAELAGTILRDIGATIPNNMAAHPRPEPEGWMLR